MKKSDILAETEERIVQIAKERPLVYADIVPIVEYIAKIKCIQFGELGVYGHDDIAQEVRLKCHKILHKFKPGMSTAFNFFGSCADNLLRDLRRKHTLRRTNVCSRCVYYRGRQCFLHNEELSQCARYKTYLENKKRKEGIARMRCDPEFAWHTQASNNFIFDNEGYYLKAIDQIKTVLPKDLNLAFRMIMANSGIAPETEEKLYAEVQTIIQNYIDW